MARLFAPPYKSFAPPSLRTPGIRVVYIHYSYIQAKCHLCLQVLHDSDEGLSNGTLDGYTKLMRTFQIMHSRIGRLNSVTTLDPQIHAPSPRQLAATSRSMSLDNLADDSPVVSLLREYSDKLVGIVHNQVDNKVYTTPTDTV